MPRGRPPTPKPGPDAYSSASYDNFLRRMDDNTSELNTTQADRRELIKAETQQGLNRKADAFVRSLRSAVRSDKMTQQDAIATLECVQVYAEWGGLTAQRDMFRQDEASKGNGKGAKRKGNGAPAATPGEALDQAKEHLGTGDEATAPQPFAD